MVILEIKKEQFWCGKAFGRPRTVVGPIKAAPPLTSVYLLSCSQQWKTQPTDHA